jgi:hypothetical protein
VSSGSPRVGLAAVPRDRQVHAEPLDETADEAVVARPHRLGLGGQRDTPRLAGRDHERRGGRVERDRQFGVAALDRPPAHRPDGIAVFGQEPGFDALEQGVARRHAQDQATA